MRLIVAVAAAAVWVGACAASPDGARPAYIVVEENASILSRDQIRRISIIEDDTLLIEVRPLEYYLVRLIGPCASMTDVMTPITIESPGAGIGRGTRFRVGGLTCPVRSIDRVEPAPQPSG